MKKQLIIAIILIAFNNIPITHAQQINYSAYQPYDIRNSDMSVVGKVNGKLYTFRSLNSEYFLDAYNSDMSIQATVILDFFPEKIENIQFIPFEQQMIVLYQAVDGTQITQYAALLDDHGRLLKGPLKIDVKKSGFFGSNNREYFATAVSEDRKQIVVYNTKTKRKNITFTTYWLDPLQLKITKRQKLSFDGGEYITHGKGMISNAGRFYLPVYSQIGNRNFSDEYELLSIKQEDPGFKTIGLPLNDNYLEYPYQRIDNINNKIYVGAFFSTQKNGNNDGAIAAAYDMNTDSLQYIKSIPFNEQLRAETGIRRKQKALNEFKINQLIIKNDGGFVLIAEESYMTTRNSYLPGMGFYSFYYSPMMTQSIREYHFNDIIALSYNANGEMEWHSIIHKEQYSQEDGGIFSSYTMLNTGGGLGFLFNDFDTRRSRIQLSSIDASGKISNGFMDTGSNDDPDWLPRMGKQVDSREIVVPCLHKKQICFAKIVL
jgi:hypothetical protein